MEPEIVVKNGQSVLFFPRYLLGTDERMVEASKFLRRIDPRKFFVEGERTDASNNLVRVISCALITDGGGAYRAFETLSAESYDSEGNLSLIVGGHVETECRSDAEQLAHTLMYRATKRGVE